MTSNSKRFTARKQNVFQSSSPAATVLSIIIPGAGQLYLKKHWRGGVILLATAVLAFVISWGMFNFKTGQVTLGGWVTSWLWLPFILFWAWNILDAYRLSSGKQSSAAWGFLLAVLILFVMSWDVTDAKPGRLVTNFNAARTVMTKLVNPDILTINVGGEDKICAWDCLAAYGRGEIQGNIRLSSNVQDIGQKMVETIAIGLLATLFSTILAVPLSFLAAHNIMSRVPGGMLVYYAMRTFFNVVRAVDTVIWGIIIIIWVGLGPFAAVIALTVHSIAALGKLYSEEIEHIDPGPVEAIQATGGNLLQVIRYAVIPQIIPPFLGYTLLRWDINMRSATVVGFVAGGGIGFFVVETIQMGGYQQYAAALWVVAVVIILVDFISSKWRENILKDQPPPEQPKHPRWTGLRNWVYVVLGLAVFFYCTNITGVSLRAMFDPGANFGSVVKAFLTIDLSPAVLPPIVKEMLITIFQALLATAIGALLAIPFSFLAAKNLTGRSRFSAWVFYLTRSLFNVLRSIEALLYVAIFV